MPLRRYTPPIERMKEDYARMCAHRLMRLRRGPRPAAPRIPDNSEPWIANPKSVADLCEFPTASRKPLTPFSHGGDPRPIPSPRRESAARHRHWWARHYRARL
jgi:hypothetical protein